MPDKIYARAHSEDWLIPIGYPDHKGPENSPHNWRLGLDVSAWFEQASDNDILALAREELGGGPVGLYIAVFMNTPDRVSAIDPRLTILFEHCKHMRQFKPMFACELYVDVTQIIPWLGNNRPHLVDQVLSILESN